MSEGPDPSRNQPDEPPPGLQPHPYHDSRSGYPPYVDQSGAQYNQYGQPYAAYPIGVPDHPQANTVLILGIVSIVACGVAGPFAWVMGNRVLAEIDAAPHQYGGRNNANIGRILGIVATALLVVSVLAAFLVIALAFAGILSSA